MGGGVGSGGCVGFGWVLGGLLLCCDGRSEVIVAWGGLGWGLYSYLLWGPGFGTKWLGVVVGRGREGGGGWLGEWHLYIVFLRLVCIERFLLWKMSVGVFGLGFYLGFIVGLLVWQLGIVCVFFYILIALCVAGGGGVVGTLVETALGCSLWFYVSLSKYFFFSVFVFHV